MPRPTIENAKHHTVCVRMTDAERKRLDQRRGALSASEFIRQAVLGRPAKKPRKAAR